MLFRSNLLLLLLGWWVLAAPAGAQYIGPQPEEFVSMMGKLEVTLSVDMTESLWKGQARYAANYNGQPVGPTLKVMAGDTLRIILVNNLVTTEQDWDLYTYSQDPASDPVNATIVANRLSQVGNMHSPEYGFWGLNFTNLHFHGLQFSATEEDVFKVVPGLGATRTYEFTIAEDQQPGLYWYHDAVHGKMSHALLSGLYGMIVVEGNEHDITQALGIRGAKQVLMIVSEGLLQDDGTVPPYFPTTGEFNWESTVNGRPSAETQYNFRVGDRVLFRVASASVEPPIRLSVPNHQMVVVAYDGIPLPSPVVQDFVQIPPGGRVEFLMQFETAGVLVMQRAPWRFLPATAAACEEHFGISVYPCISYDEVKTVATLNVQSAATAFQAGLSPWHESVILPSPVDRFAQLEEQEPVTTKMIYFQHATDFPLFQIPADDSTSVGLGMAFGIDDELYNPSYSMGNVTAGTCETWLVMSNNPSMEFAFSTHAGPFRVLSIDGVDLDPPQWRDSYPLTAEGIKIHVCMDRLRGGEKVLVVNKAAARQDIGMATYFTVHGPDEPDESVPDQADQFNEQPVEKDDSSARNRRLTASFLTVGMMAAFVLA